MLKKKHTFIFKRNSSLQKEVLNQLKGTNREIHKLLKDKPPRWVPSLSSLIKFFIVVAILGCISHIHEIGIIPSQISEYISTNLTIQSDSMIAICVGIGAVLVGLAFFIAQSFLDKEDADRGRALLYKSKFYVLLSIDIAILLICVLGKPNILVAILIFLLGLYTIWILSQTVNLLLYVNEMEKAKLELLLEIINKYVVYEIQRRVSYQIFFETEKKMSTKYSGLSLNPFNNDINLGKIKAKYSGTLIDINFGKIERFYKNNYNNSNEIVNLNINILPYSFISENTVMVEMNCVGGIKKLEEKREKILRSFFKIKRTDFEETVEIEISKLKQRCLILIEKERSDELKKALFAYKEIARKFIESLEKVNWKFTREQAEKQMVAFPGERFNILDWILESFRIIFNNAINSNNFYIIKNVTNLPIYLAALSIKRNDHLIFQNFIRYPVIMYNQGYHRKKENKEASDFIIKKSGRYLKAFSTFLKQSYEDTDITEPDFIDYSCYIYKTFQSLMKQSYENQDFDNFQQFLSKHMKLYECLDNNTRFTEIGETTFYKINNIRHIVLFGIGSWILNRYLEKGNNNRKIYQ